MRRFQKWFPYIIGSILVLLGFYVFCRGLLIAGENGWGGSGFFKKLPGKIEELAVDTYNGVLTWETETETGKDLEKVWGGGWWMCCFRHWRRRKRRGRKREIC